MDNSTHHPYLAMQCGNVVGDTSEQYQSTVVQRVRKQCRTTPHAVALQGSARSMTYAELGAFSDRLAGVLAVHSIAMGDLVGLCIARSFEQIAAILAIWEAGAAVVLFDPDWPDGRIESIATESGCNCLMIKGRGDRFAALGLSLISVNEDAAPVWSDPTQANPASLAYVIYTSGSTGTPKGVAIGHDNLENLIDWHVNAFQITQADRGSHLAGLGFDAAIWEVWPYLSAGATVALVEDGVRTSPRLLRDWILANRITVAFVPTAMVKPMLELPWPADTALRFMLTGAEQLLIRPAAGLPFTLVNNYGPTECTVVATSAPVRPLVTGQPPIGWPIHGTRIHILDQNGEPVPDNVMGEIYVSGANVGRGYLGRDAETALRFMPDRFSAVAGTRMFRTGDFGRRMADGQIEFHGRTDDAVKILGHRVELAEVSAALATHPFLSNSIVVARNRGDGVRLIGYVVLRPGRVLDLMGLREALALQLPAYMIPDTFVRLDALPLTHSGKVDKAALPDPDAANTLGATKFEAPRTPTEQRLTDIMCEVMGGQAVGINDNFFLIGGHSLLGTQIVLRASEAFGVRLSLRDLFLAPTISQMCQVIEGRVEALVDSLTADQAMKKLYGDGG